MIRLDENHVLIETPHKAVILFANERVFVDRASIEEITAFTEVCGTIEKLKAAGYLSAHAHIEDIILTPDFHKGAGIPIGTVFASHGLVIPRAVGSDIGCGMRFIMTDVKRSEFDAIGDKLDQILRYIFFEGGRNIPLSAEQRKAIFQAGLLGLTTTEHSKEGIWEYWDDERQGHDRIFTHQFGNLDTNGVFPFDDFIKGSGTEFTRDDQTGSIGGGNHFCEFQVVEETFDRHKSYEWGIRKDQIALMVHSGSVGIGHQVGNHFTDLARSLYPPGLKHENDHYILPDTEDGRDYLSAMGNAGNFAYVNRLFLGLMMIRALSEALGRKIETRVVWDAPHNLVWEEDGGYIHRKGATPAEDGDPVIIPGSMGSSSFILAGLGNRQSFCSACHGAGRAKARQQGRSTSQELPCRVVTKIDPRRVRKDIRDDYMKSLMEEAPDKYKDITPVIETVEGAGIASKVARTFPLLTVKGL